MSIQSQINRINNNITAAYSAVEAKDGALPATQNSDNLASAISSISRTNFVDSNPIGTIISFMGTQAPDSYLICDGAEYNIADYPDLASFFTRQFGAANYFGGDGTTTFAVPNVQGKFILGASDTHTIGETGGEEEVTLTKNQMPKHNHPIYTADSNGPVGTTSMSCTWGNRTASKNYSRTETTGGGQPHNNMPPYYAMLICIKAHGSIPSEHSYSTEETLVGTWTDGKPLYRRVVTGSSAGNGQNDNVIATIPNIKNIVYASGIMLPPEGSNQTDTFPCEGVDVALMGEDLVVMVWDDFHAYREVVVIVEYTKTTD